MLVTIRVNGIEMPLSDLKKITIKNPCIARIMNEACEKQRERSATTKYPIKIS